MNSWTVGAVLALVIVAAVLIPASHHFFDNLFAKLFHHPAPGTVAPPVVVVPLPVGAPLPRGGIGKGGFGSDVPDDAVTIANKAKIAAMLAIPYVLRAVDLAALNTMIRLGQKADPTSYDPITGKVTGNDPSFVIQAKAVRGEPTTDTERAYMAYLAGTSPFRVTNNPDGTSTVGLG